MEALYIHIAKSLEKIRQGRYPILEQEEETRLKYNLGLVEVDAVKVWRALTAEFLAQMLFVFVVCLATINLNRDVLGVSFAAGLALMAMVQTVAHSSGGHINPAVTLARAVVREIPPVRAAGYVVAQCMGAIAGASMAKSFVNPSVDQNNHVRFGVTALSDGVNSIQGLCVETLLTFVLVSVTFGLTDRNRLQFGSQPLVIGLTYTMGHLCAFSYTGSSMNPSRSLGPAFASNSWQDHWIYWVGPIVGGVLAGLVYKYIFARYFQATTADTNELLKKDINNTHPGPKEYEIYQPQEGTGSVAATEQSDKMS